MQKLEQCVAELLGVKHCVATCNGTIALALVVRALDLKGEVIIPSFSFISTAHALRWQGIDPVFCDIDPITWNLDPAQCEAVVTDRTTAIIGTHLWGRPCDEEKLKEITARHRLHLVFDAAHAFGCTHRRRYVGGFGDAEVFSFHATKVFHTFEGGAVTTNDARLAERLRSLRNFGFTDFDTVDALGTNAKMPEICAAMGLVNLESLNHFIAENQRTYERYRRGLNGIRGLRLLRYDTQARHNHHYVVVDVDEREAGLSRDDFVAILRAENVMARRYFYPGNHRMEPYCKPWRESGRALPVTERVASRVLVLPGGTEVTDTEVDQTCSILRLAVANSSRLKVIMASKEAPH